MARRLAQTLLLLLVCCLSLSLLLAAAQVATPQRVRVSQGVAQGLLLHKVDPLYPPLARQARIQGTVVLKVLVNKSGDVEKAEPVSGHPMLGPAAIAAVKQWRYQTYLLNGEPVEMETQVTVNFTLSDAAAPPDAGDNMADAPPSPAPADNMQVARPQRVRVSKGVAQAMLVGKVAPAYPAEARAARIQGVVELKVNIDKEGNVYRVELISGDATLAAAAMEAVRQWKYKPYLLNGDAVEVETTVQVNFTLRG